MRCSQIQFTFGCERVRNWNLLLSLLSIPLLPRCSPDPPPMELTGLGGGGDRRGAAGFGDGGERRGQDRCGGAGLGAEGTGTVPPDSGAKEGGVVEPDLAAEGSSADGTGAVVPDSGQRGATRTGPPLSQPCAGLRQGRWLHRPPLRPTGRGSCRGEGRGSSAAGKGEGARPQGGELEEATGLRFLRGSGRGSCGPNASRY